MGYDCYQILLKGQGLYWKFDTVAHASNLHLIYELLPMGFLIEKAGGVTDDGTGHSVLDTPIQGFGQRVSFIAGSSESVQHLSTLIN